MRSRNVEPISILNLASKGKNALVGIEIDNFTKKLYVLDRNSSVYVIDTDTDKQLPQKIAVLPKPNDMVLDKNKNHSILYVKYDNSRNISAINLKGLHGQKNQFPIKLAFKPGAMALSDDGSLHFTVGRIVSRQGSQQNDNGLYKLNEPYTVFDAKARLDGEFTNINRSIIDFGTNHPNATGIEIIANSKSKLTYIMNKFTETIVVVNDKGQINNIVQVGKAPNNIALDTKRNRMYVTNDEGSLVVVDLDMPSNSIGVGTNPSGIAVDPRTHLIYVANFGSNDISVLEENGSKLQARKKISLDGASVRLNAAVGLSGISSNILKSSFNSTFASPKVIKQYSPSSLAINPNNQKIYVANYNDNSMSVIDGTKQKNKLILTMPVGQKPSSIDVDSNSSNKEIVYVANQADDSVSAIDIANVLKNNASYKENTQTIKVGEKPVDIAVNKKTHMVYVANFENNSISVIDGTKDKKKVIQTIQVGVHPSSIAINPENNILYVLTKAQIQCLPWI